MKPSEVYPLFGPPTGALGQRLRPAAQAAIEREGLEQPAWFVLVVALDFEPEPVSAHTYLKRTPYAARQNFEAPLVKLAEIGLMETVGAGEYRITSKGHEVANRILSMYELLRDCAPLPAADLDRLIALAGRLVSACETAPEPPDKFSLIHNRHSDPGPGGMPLYRLLQFSADLGSFRDDCHLAAWQPYGVSGPAWEALTFIWRDEAHTAAELAEKLSFRNLTVEDYAAALRELEAKGWIAADRVTEQGLAVRQSAEEETDRLFYAPWSALSQSDLDELGDRLVRLANALEAKVKPQ